MAPFIICIDGLIGAGKSALLQTLASEYATFPEPEWTLLTQMYENKTKFALPFQLQVLISQFQQRQLFPDEGVVLVERCPWTARYIFVPLVLPLRHFNVYHTLHEALAYDVDYLIYLDVDPVEAYRRIRDRSPADRHITLDYLHTLRRQYMARVPKSHFVDANQSPDQVARDVRAKIIASLSQVA